MWSYNGNNRKDFLCAINNQRLGTAGVYHALSGPGPLGKFQVIEGPNARNPIAFNPFQSSLEEVQTNAGYIPAARMEQPGNYNCNCRPQVTIKLLLAYLHINQKATF